MSVLAAACGGFGARADVVAPVLAVPAARPVPVGGAPPSRRAAAAAAAALAEEAIFATPNDPRTKRPRFTSVHIARGDSPPVEQLNLPGSASPGASREPLSARVTLRADAPLFQVIRDDAALSLPYHRVGDKRSRSPSDTGSLSWEESAGKAW